MTDTQLRATRRTLVRGVAWSVPVVSIAAAAPAFAASCDTQKYVLDWGTTSFTPGPTTGAVRVASASVGGTTGGGSLVVTFTSTVQGTVTRTATNMTVGGTNVGGLGGAALQLTHDNIQTTRANRQEVLITFDRAVTGLSFTIADIDSQTDSWYDQVELTGTTGATPVAAATFTQSPVATTSNTAVNVWGDGSAASPWRPRAGNLNAGAGSSTGNKTVTFTSAVKTLTLVYWNSAGSRNQVIALTDFTFTAKGC